MTLVNMIDGNVLSLVMLAFIVYDARRRSDNPSDMRHKLFISLTIILALLLVADALGRAFDQYPGQAFYLINWGANVALFILVPIAPALWLLYAIYQISRETVDLRVPVVILTPLLLANTAISFLSIHTGWYFTVDSSNVYHRGPWFVWIMAICFLITVTPIAVTIANRRQIDRRRFYSLLVSPTPTIIGAILQSIFYGTSFIWCCMTISMLFMYFTIQAERQGTDYLTGVYNRRRMDEFVSAKMQAGAPNKSFSAILVDIDNFKRINDAFGHKVGDQALIMTATLLKNCLRKNDFIARFGGDEFLIVLDIDSPETLQDTVMRLHDTFAQFNRTRSAPYTLSFSCGYAVCSPEHSTTQELFFQHIDALMYQDKKARKRIMARSNLSEMAADF